MAAPAPEYGNYVLGKGRVFVARYFRDGTYGPLRYVGTSTEFNVNTSTENYDYYTGDCGPNEKVISVTTQTNRSVTLTLDDMTWENMALALGGDVSTVTRATSTVTDEEVDTVQLGYHYPLGVDEANPLGVFGSVTDVVVKEGANTLIEGDDYLVNYTRGIVQILTDGDVAEGDSLKVSYKVSAEVSVRIEATPDVGDNIKIVFEACNESGDNRDAIVPLIALRPSGDVAFRGTEAQTLTFEGDILKHPSLPTIILDGRAA